MTSVLSPAVNIPAPGPAPQMFPNARITLGHQIRSEVIKLVSLRSPWWSAGLVAAINIGITALFAFAVASTDFDMGGDDNVTIANSVLMPTMFTVLLASIIGTMLVTGEYATGMIRSTLTAAPDRLRSLIAKVIVTATFIFVTALATMIVAIGVSSLIFATKDIALDFSDPGAVVLPYLFGAIYLALVGVIGVGIGYIIRNGAGAISIVVGIMFILPMIPSFIGMIPSMEWIFDAAHFLPTLAGQDFMIGTGDMRLQGALVLIGWAVVTTALGALVLKRRDA